MIRFTLLVLIAFSLSGCGLTARQAQNLSDGLAGIEAAQPRVATDPVATAALAGAHDYVEATAEGEVLPPPKRTPAAIMDDPAGYAEDASKSADEAQSIVPWWGWLAGAGAAALGILRFVPGMGGAMADAAWMLLAPAQHQLADTKRNVHAQGFQTLVEIIEHLPKTATITDLKSRVTTKAPSRVRDEINLQVAELIT